MSCERCPTVTDHLILTDLQLAALETVVDEEVPNALAIPCLHRFLIITACSLAYSCVLLCCTNNQWYMSLLLEAHPQTATERSCRVTRRAV
jgi:hypothetical protein